MILDELKTRQLLSANNNIWFPPPDLTVAQWADMYRRISPEASAEPGIWRTSRAEYQREIMNAVSDFQTERVVMMTAAQIGKTEILLNIIGYYIDQEPSPILILDPTIEMGMSFSKDRLAPMVRDTPVLQGKIKDPRSRDSGNTILHKKFIGGHITIAGANSPASLASRPIRILLCDEVDRYPVSAGTEGDPLSLAAKRTQNFWNRRIIWVSTPTLKDVSRIEKAFNDSSREEWCVPCPKCGEYQPFTWEQMIFKDVREPVMKCRKCGSMFHENAWKAGRFEGKWIAENPDEKHTRGFHFNAFASGWVSWEKLIAQYNEALKNGDEELKVWWNTVLGLPYENSADTIEVSSFEAHRDTYGAELPHGVLVLTAGIDTQDDRLECEVVGWGVGKESWGIDYRIFYGDPALKDVWEALDEYLLSTWSFANGEKLGISCAFIDSAGHFTDEVYKFCKPRSRRNIFPIVGRGRVGIPSVSKPNRNNRRRVPLFTVGVSTIKGVLYSRLRLEQRGVGYCHFPNEPKNNNHRGYDETYFKGLVSEKMVIKRMHGRDVITWEVRSKHVRNEPLDCRVYATAAMELFNPDFEARSRKITRVKKSMPKLKEPELNTTDDKQIAKSEPNNSTKIKRRGIKILRRGGIF